MAEQFPLTLENVIRFSWQGASDPDLTADGRHVIYADEGMLWSVATAGGEPQRLTEGAGPRCSPVGDEIAFLRGEPAQLWVRDAAGGERPVTDLATGVTTFAWSPDGRRIAVVSPLALPAAVDREDPAATIIEVHQRVLPPGRRLLVVDPVTGGAERVAESTPGVDWLRVAWRPNGRSLALWERVMARDLDEADHPAVLDLETGELRYPAGRSRRPGYFLCWSPDGTRLAFAHSPHDFLHPFRTILGVVQAAGGEVECFDGDYFIEDVGGYLDGHTVLCLGGRGVGLQVLRVDTATRRVEPLTGGAGDHGPLRLSSDGQRVVCTYRTPTTLPEVCLLSTDGRERQPLTRLSERLKRFRLAEVETVRWAAPDGLPIEGLLVKPLDHEPGRRSPVIVDLHGGPIGGVRADLRPEWHWLAAHGYLIFAPDFRGGQTYGWYGPPAEAEPDYEELDFHDVMSGVDWLLEADYADPERLGVYGFSYGADLINRIISRTHRFRAAVARAGGVAPLDVEYGSMLGGNAIRARELGGKPWEVPEVYQRHNPMTHLHQARTPTLILNGESDDGTGAWVLYTWLYQLGVPVEYVRYRGEGHVIGQPEHRADCWRRTLAWFDRHLRA
jgi:dipeptidyl aminopeptidase/acylaminoacyl peptidase